MNGKLSRALGRIAMQSRLIINGHILNPLWRDRDSRRKCRYEATFSSLIEYLRRYADNIGRINLTVLDAPAKEPERAFTIWYQGEENAPDLVKACFRSMRRNLKQEVIVLDENTLFDWITLPDYIIEKWKKGIILHTQFSDICRVELLYEHGGLWFDATDYVTAPVPQWIMDEDFFFFMAGNKVRGSYAFLQSCFIRGRKGNPLLDVWRKADFLYWKEENSKIDYFVHHLLFRLAIEVNESASDYFKKMPQVDQDPTHELWGAHCMETYDEMTFNKLTSGSFFQKTNYKDKRIRASVSGTIAEHIINS
jgi:hypothetical protein